MKRLVLIALVAGLFAFAASASAEGRGEAYRQYIARYADAPRPTGEMILPAADALLSGSAELLPVYEGVENVAVLSDSAEAAMLWRFTAPADGLYAMEMTYCLLPGGEKAVWTLETDGECPYDEARALAFTGCWRNAESVRRDDRGNDLCPRQEQIAVYQTAPFSDPMGAFHGALQLYLTAGTHEIKLTSGGDAVAVSAIRLYAAENIPAYAAYAEARAGLQDNARGVALILEGEDAAYKSDSSITPVNDRTSPLNRPYDPALIRMNALGGERWQYAGQWAEWVFSVPEDGYYEMSAIRRIMCAGCTSAVT